MHNEQVFTPEWMVKILLDQVGFYSFNLVDKHIMDNSCGKGVILIEAVKRYIEVHKECHDGCVDVNEARTYLETYIHGIEIDEAMWGITVANLNRLTLSYGIENVDWDIRNGIVNGDALAIDTFDGKMDFVVGNPPYCNVHDISEEQYNNIKENYTFCADGMTDIYLAFFEKGIRMLKPDGKLVYITPSSWTTSVAGRKFREYLTNSNKLSAVGLMKHERVFKNATTFTIITCIDNSRDKAIVDAIDVKEYRPEFEDIEYKATRSLSGCTVDGKFYFDVDGKGIGLLRDLHEGNFGTHVTVKNGFATLNDKLFLVDEDDMVGLNDYDHEKLIIVFKASTGEKKYMIFPYDKKGKPVNYDSLDFTVRNLLEKNARKLHLNIENKPDWYLYGRTQALGDVFKNKVVVNNLIRNKNDIKVEYAMHGQGVYSGYYIPCESVYEMSDIYNLIRTNEFAEYVKSLGKYKNGGYYTFSSKDLQSYLNYKIETTKK